MRAPYLFALAMAAALPAMAQQTPPAVEAPAEGALPADMPAIPAAGGAPGEWYVEHPDGSPSGPGEPVERPALHDVLRGKAVSARYSQPLEFILDLHRQPGYEPDRFDVSGWIGSLAPTVGFGGLSGSCLATLCVVTADLADRGRLTLRLDFAGAVVKGTFTVAPDTWSAADVEGTVELAAQAGEEVDLGLAGKLDAAGLGQALSLAGFIPDQYAEEGTPPSASERTAFAAWQRAHDKHPTGLVTAADWALLQQEADTAAQAAGWTTLADDKAGWSLSYPANVLTESAKIKGGRRLLGANGFFSLEITVKPPLDDEAFEVLWEGLKAETKTRSVGSYSRSNQDLWLQAEEKGQRETVVVHGRPGGLLRLTIRYPADRVDEFTLYEELIRASVKVSDDLKP